MIIPYDTSKEERDKIIKEREKRLYQSFENMRKQIDDQIQTMNFSTVSEKVKRQQLEEIRNELQKQLQSHYNALESGLKDDMVNIGQQVLNESETFYKALNMPIGMSITSFPVEIMNNVVNGSVYQEKWYLSRALWGDYTEKLDQINEVISNGICLNLPSFDIAKQLEQYVDPSAMTPSKTIVTHCLQDPVTGKLYSMDYVKRHPEKDWTGFKEKDSKFRYGKVDYNAQRLARTLISHAYQQNVVHQAQANPFATGVRWDASGGERMCDICEERDGKIFPADDVPLDHPNGMCTFEVVTDLNMMEMSNVLADFVNGEPTEYDDKLYAWYNDRAEVPIERAPDMFAQQLNEMPRVISAEEFNDEAERQGLDLTAYDIDDYVTSSYGDLKLCDEISRFIDNAPDELKAYSKDPAYRGLHFDSEKEFNRFIKNHSVGSTLESRRDGLSWTMSEKVAKEFSINSGGYAIILVNEDEYKNAINIKGFADTPDSSEEILYSSSSDFEIIDIEKRNGIVYMYVTEEPILRKKYN